MKRHYKNLINLGIVLSLLFTMAFKCGDGGGGGEANNGESFAAGHKLKGRYMNRNNGIRTITFMEDGTFQRAVYENSGKSAGKYYIDGNTLSLNYEDGNSEELYINIAGWGERNYDSATPAMLTIGGLVYDNVYDE